MALEGRDDFRVAALTGEIGGRGARLVAQPDLRSGVEQRRDDLGVPRRRRGHERGAPLAAGHTEVVAALLDAGAKVGLRDEAGSTDRKSVV